MQTFRFNPAIGQRFVHRLAGAADTFWTLTSIQAPRTLVAPVLMTFTEEITQRVFHRSTAHLAQDILVGNLREQQVLLSSKESSNPIALSNLLATMSQSQLRTYKTRVSYVLAIDRAGVGQSHKSLAFCSVIEELHQQRMAAWQAHLEESPGRSSEGIESQAPAPTTVYRWFLRYRKAGNDLHVLANSVLATRTRKPRKPKERELLAAFLACRTSFIEQPSVTAMTAEFNRLIANANPLQFDVLIQELYEQASQTSQANKLARSGKNSMSSKRHSATANKAFPTQTY